MFFVVVWLFCFAWIGGPVYLRKETGEKVLNWHLKHIQTKKFTYISEKIVIKWVVNISNKCRTPHTLTSPNDVHHSVNLSNTTFVPYTEKEWAECVQHDIRIVLKGHCGRHTFRGNSNQPGNRFWGRWLRHGHCKWGGGLLLCDRQGQRNRMCWLTWYVIFM